MVMVCPSKWTGRWYSFVVLIFHHFFFHYDLLLVRSAPSPDPPRISGEDVLLASSDSGSSSAHFAKRSNPINATFAGFSGARQIHLLASPFSDRVTLSGYGGIIFGATPGVYRGRDPISLRPQVQAVLRRREVEQRDVERRRPDVEVTSLSERSTSRNAWTDFFETVVNGVRAAQIDKGRLGFSDEEDPENNILRSPESMSEDPDDDSTDIVMPWVVSSEFSLGTTGGGETEGESCENQLFYVVRRKGDSRESEEASSGAKHVWRAKTVAEQEVLGSENQRPPVHDSSEEPARRGNAKNLPRPTKKAPDHDFPLRRLGRAAFFLRTFESGPYMIGRPYDLRLLRKDSVQSRQLQWKPPPPEDGQLEQPEWFDTVPNIFTYSPKKSQKTEWSEDEELLASTVEEGLVEYVGIASVLVEQQEFTGVLPPAMHEGGFLPPAPGGVVAVNYANGTGLDCSWAGLVSQRLARAFPVKAGLMVPGGVRAGEHDDDHGTRSSQLFLKSGPLGRLVPMERTDARELATAILIDSSMGEVLPWRPGSSILQSSILQSVRDGIARYERALSKLVGRVRNAFAKGIQIFLLYFGTLDLDGVAESGIERVARREIEQGAERIHESLGLRVLKLPPLPSRWAARSAERSTHELVADVVMSTFLARWRSFAAQQEPLVEHRPEHGHTADDRRRTQHDEDQLPKNSAPPSFRKYDIPIVEVNGSSVSESDGGRYVQTVSDALVFNRTFGVFKMHPWYNGILEHVTYREARWILQLLAKMSPDMLNER